MSMIYFDEHGNTGEFLIDPEQPVFTLASNDYSDEEASDLLGPLRSQGAIEVKFKTLRKSRGGIARLARFFADPRVNSTRIAAFTVDKRMMVLNKMLDIVLETLMHKMAGIDFNEDGLNLATSNMLHLTVPVLAGQDVYDALLGSFERLIRKREASATGRGRRGATRWRKCELPPPYTPGLAPGRERKGKAGRSVRARHLRQYPSNGRIMKRAHPGGPRATRMESDGR